MARNFLSFPFAPYQGTYSSKAFNSDSGQKGLLVALDILWNTYLANGQQLGPQNPNFSVSFNLNTAGPNTVSAQWYVQSVYIDNEGVDFPVYVYFLDSLFTVSCPANSAGWYQVFTNGRQGLISAIGVDQNAITTGQLTRLFFTDVAMVPSLDQEIASSLDYWKSSPATETLTPNNQAFFDTPALGDTVRSVQLNINNAGQTPILPPVFNYKYVIITSIFWSISNWSYSVGASNVEVSMTSISSSPFSINVGISNTPVLNQTILQMSGINLKIDGTLQYNLVASASGVLISGIINSVIAYTYSNT